MTAPTHDLPPGMHRQLDEGQPDMAIVGVPLDDSPRLPPYSKAAIWGFILAFIAPLVGVFFSHFGIVHTKSDVLRGRTLAVWGLVLSYLGVVRDIMVIWMLAGWIVWISFGTLMGMQPDDWKNPVEFYLESFGLF